MSEKQKTAVRAGLLVIAVLFALLGGWRGEVRTVFIKAANVCLECIGIG